jgi:hypothetical protein
MDDREREDLLDALVERLRREGAPAGEWLVDVMRARAAIGHLDELLRRLQAALLEEPNVDLVVCLLPLLLDQFT